MSKLALGSLAATFLILGCAKSNAVEQPVAWEFSVGGFIADAAAQDEAVYVGASDGNFYALDSKTGGVSWSKPLGLGVFSRPANHGDSVFVAGSTGEPFKPDTLGPAEIVSMRNSDGEVLWRFEMDGSFQPQVYPHADRVVGTVASRVYCLDTQTGDVRWDFKHRTGMIIGIAQNDALVVVQGADGRLKAIHAADGSEAWSASARSKVYFRPIVAEDLVFTGNITGELIAINIGTGEEAWSIKTSGGLEGRCALVDDSLLFTNRNAEVYAVDIRTGAERWKQTYKVAGKNSSQFAGIDAAGGRFAFSALNKGVFVLDAETGDELKHIPVDAPMSFVTLSGDVVLHTPLGKGVLTAVSLVQ